MARSIVGIAASVGAVSVLLGLPVASGAQTGVDAADQLVEHVRGTVDGVVPGVLPAKPNARPAPSAGVQRQAQPAQPRGSTPGSPGGYQPPLHGPGPHGQGTVGVIDLSPGGTRPLSPNPSGSQPQPQDNEDIVVGRARGEQDAQGYHGHITVAALLGNELVGVDSRPGQTVTGPLEAVQQGVLNNLCNGTANQVCLTVLQADSTTTGTSSTNKFAVTRAQVGGPTGINAGAAESQGNLSQDANCQTATGSSSVANVGAGGAPVVGAANSSSQSRSCRDGSGSQTNSSSLLGVGGQPLALPAAGCGDGTPDTVTGIPVLAPIVCNANDSGGLGESLVQAAERYGVREALSVFALDVGGTSALRATTSASESVSRAPAAPPAAPPRTKKKVKQPARRPGTPRRRSGGPGPGPRATPSGPSGPVGPGGPERQVRAAGSRLAFTGADVLLLLLLGSFTLLTGVCVRRATTRVSPDRAAGRLDHDRQQLLQQVPSPSR